MRILFVSSVIGGGSGTSQRQLAARLVERGHEVQMLAATPVSRVVRPMYDEQVDLTSRLRTSRIGGGRPRTTLLRLQRPWGRRVRRTETSDHPTWLAAVPENAFSTFRRRLRPDVVVASSIERVSWRRIRAQARTDRIPTVLYLREASAIGHLTITGAVPDLLLANAASLANAACDAGFPCAVVPSVVEVDRVRTESTRAVVLAVNPIEMLGRDRIFATARACPDLPFVVQESGLLSDEERRTVHAAARELPNVEVRPFAEDPRRMFRDARVLFVPHRVDNRPRVVLEAQTNGIPVVATRYPGLVESVGPGGRIVEDTDDPMPWARALREIWTEPTYGSVRAAASAHAVRPGVTPEDVVDRFEEHLRGLVARGAEPPQNP